MADHGYVTCQGITVIQTDLATVAPFAPPAANGAQRIPLGHPKSIDWRRKLAQWAVDGFDKNGTFGDHQFILTDFPQGFELWEHPRASHNADGTRISGRTSSDAYLYGHRNGKYRSPGDFLWHLLYLGSAERSGGCTCSLCNLNKPQGVSENKNKNKVQADKPGKPTRKTQTPTSASSPEKPTSAISQYAGAHVLKEQAFDALPDGDFIYRPGELIWFNRDAHTWGLGVISKRKVINRTARYEIQPLSHPFSHPDPQVKDSQEGLRPWLAWSVPALGNTAFQNLTYANAPWESALPNYPTDAVVDGSILAAKAIDASYSLFARDMTALTAPGEQCYRGIFIGAEKVWTGEPVRVRGPDDDILVMVIKKILDRPTSPEASEVTFIGDIYKFIKMPTEIMDRDLPARMVNDLDFRNSVEKAHSTGTWNEWRIAEPNARRGLADIKGRWYETKALLPVLKGQKNFKDDLEKCETGDAGQWMNSRGDLNPAFNSIKKEDREQTFGDAVPDEFRVSWGLDDPESALL